MTVTSAWVEAMRKGADLRELLAVVSAQRAAETHLYPGSLDTSFPFKTSLSLSHMGGYHNPSMPSL